MGHDLGAIAAGHDRTALAGAQMLAEGGNAVDAAVAAVFAACTCEPTLTGLGGGGFATIHMAGGPNLVLDFFASVPGIGRTVETATGPVSVDVLFGSTTQTFHVGPQSCAVPGFVAGVLGAHERFGRLPRERVLQPGIDLALQGLELTPEQAYCHHLLEKIVTRRSSGRAVFAPDGPMLVDGDHFAQPELAATLELLAAEGADCFYRGTLARELAQWADDNGGLLTLEDLERYSVRQHDPAESHFRSLAFLSVPPPSSGGALVAYALQILDELRGDAPIDIDSPDGAELLIGSMLAAQAIRGAEFDRYLYGTGLSSWLLSPEVVARGVEYVRSGQVDPSTGSAPSLGSTTHLSVIDGEGNAIALTTSTGCGSGEFVGSTGIHLNNMLGEEDLVPVEHQLVPGDRLTSMMAPSLLLHEGKPVLATGSAGSSRLRSAILQSLVRLVESRYLHDDRTLQQRLAAATSCDRLHPEGGLVHVEPGYADEPLAQLERRGHRLNRWPHQNLYFGGVNMVAVEQGKFAAAADPRRGGGAYLARADGSLEAL